MTTTLQQGKDLRKQVSRKTQAQFTTQPGRPSIADIIKASDHDRLPELIPIRHQRMSVSPFSFYRATASIMAYDLAPLARTNIIVQALGDCHVMNFGGYATPERSLVFDLNDFDETHPASWEWDVKRLAASFVLAARDNKLKAHDDKEMAFTLVQSYRTHILEYEQMNKLDLWYMKFDLETIIQKTKNPKFRELMLQGISKAQKDNNSKLLYKFARNVSGNFEITDQPPLIYHTDESSNKEVMHQFLTHYRKTLQPDKRFLFDEYRLADSALKVVGVGSVGTRCYILLLTNAREEPLFLQVKEAKESVLEPYTTKSRYEHCGERVVNGQKLVQAASDIFLGWSTGSAGRYYYLRQLRDRKIAPAVNEFDRDVLIAYARLCGRILARAHAKTGDATLIAGYMGKSESMEDAVSDFALTYAHQTERDYDDFMKAVKSGLLPIR